MYAQNGGIWILRDTDCLSDAKWRQTVGWHRALLLGAGCIMGLCQRNRVNVYPRLNSEEFLMYLTSSQSRTGNWQVNRASCLRKAKPHPLCLTDHMVLCKAVQNLLLHMQHHSSIKYTRHKATEKPKCLLLSQYTSQCFK